jgi:hypothetical protein
MRTFPENFNCVVPGVGGGRLGAPKVIGRDIIIPIMEVPVSDPHPLGPSGKDKAAWQHPVVGWVVNGLFVFRDVFLSRRIMDEYIGSPNNPDGFKDEYVHEDINLELPCGVLRAYPFEGVMSDPPAWVTWEIIARSFEFHVE